MKKILTIILSLSLVVSSLILLLLMPIKKNLNNNFMKEVITSIDVEKMVESNPQVKKQIDKKLTPLYDVTREVGLSDEVIIKIFNLKEVKELLGDVANNIYLTILTEKSHKLIQPQEIENIIGEAIDDINKTRLYFINDETKTKVLNTIKEEIAKYQDYIPNTNIVLDSIPKEEQQIINLSKFILSKKFLKSIILIIIISFLGILVLNLSKGKWLKYSAINILIASLISLILTIIFTILNKIYFQTNYLNIYNIGNKILKTSYILNVIIISFIILILIIYHLKNKINSKKVNVKA